MRVLMLIAVVFLVIALICSLVPTMVLTISSGGWLIAGLMVWAIDVLLGGYPLVVGTRQQ